MSLRSSSTSSEGVFQASKYLKSHFLVEDKDLSDFFSLFPSIFLYPLTDLSGREIPIQDFLAHYGAWIKGLKNGELPKEKSMREVLASALTLDPRALFSEPIPKNRFLIKVIEPVVYIRAHNFHFAEKEKRFYSMTLGPSSIFWGLEFSYPQIYLEPKTGALKKGIEHPNFSVFQKMQRWLREKTIATPFLVNGERINAPMRLGKSCFSWINSHPGLKAKGLEVLFL